MLFGATTPSVAASLQICIWYVAAGLVTTAMNSTWFCVGSFEAMFPKDELCPLLAPSQYRRTCDQTSPPPPILHQSVTLYAPASGNVMLVVEKENPHNCFSLKIPYFFQNTSAFRTVSDSLTEFKKFHQSFVPFVF